MNNPKPKDIYQQVGAWISAMNSQPRNEEDLLNGAFELLSTLYETYWDEQENQ